MLISDENLFIYIYLNNAIISVYLKHVCFLVFKMWSSHIGIKDMTIQLFNTTKLLTNQCRKSRKYTMS